jgi:26S proteasome regulatory subunit N1
MSSSRPIEHLSTGVQASDSYDATIETLKAIPHQSSKQIQVLVEMCAFAGTGNVLRVQTMLQQCGEHLNAKDATADSEQENEKKKAETKQDDTFQAFAVLGISLVAMGEDIGAEMSLRQFNHLVRMVLSVIAHTMELKCINTDALWRSRNPKERTPGPRSRLRFEPTTPYPRYPFEVQS